MNNVQSCFVGVGPSGFWSAFRGTFRRLVCAAYFGCVAGAVGQTVPTGGGGGPTYQNGESSFANDGFLTYNIGGPDWGDQLIESEFDLRSQVVSDVYMLDAITGYLQPQFWPIYDTDPQGNQQFVAVPPADIQRNHATWLNSDNAGLVWGQGSNVLGELHEIRLLEYQIYEVLRIGVDSVWTLIGAFLAFCIFRYVKLH